MQKSFKRILGVFLAVVMIATVLMIAPLSASAADVFQEEGSIALGETKTVDLAKLEDPDSRRIALWEFTPTEAMTVAFYSSSADSTDTYGHIYDKDMNELKFDDDSAGNGDFKIKYDLTANITYYFGARLYSSNSSGSFNVTLEQLTVKTVHFVSNGENLVDITVTDPNEIDREAIPVPTNAAPGKAFVGYSNGDKLIFSHSGYGFSWENYLSSSDFTNDELTLTATWADAPEFLGETVSLDSVIRLNLYVDMKQFGDYFSVSAKDLDTELLKEGTERQYAMSSDYVAVAGRENVFIVTVDVFAKEIADNIEVSISFYNGSNYLSTSTVASVKEYLETLAASPEAYAPAGKADALKNLCYATLNYGAAAQKQFGHYGDLDGHMIPLANENVPATYTANAVPDDLAVDSGSQADFSDYKLSYYASSLGLFSDTGYAICFEDLDEDYTRSVSVLVGDEFCDSETVGYATYTTTDEEGYPQTTEHSMIAFNIRGIAAKHILDDIEVNFGGYVNGYYDENDDYKWVDGYDLPERTYTFSPRTYIVKVLTQAGVDPDYTYGDLDHEYGGGTYNSKEQQQMSDLVVTVKAIYDYSTRASAYFD